MKTQGCEIEAKGINYQIAISRRAHPRGGEEEERQQQEEALRHHHTASCTKQLGAAEASTKLPKLRVRNVLKNVSCHARPSEILAIVGPSGAGKSTLLEILAGKLTPASPPTIIVNGKPIDKFDFRKISGYVAQKDTLFPLLTVRETLLFSARLRLGGCNDQSYRVDNLIQELGLKRVADTRVGADDGRVRGISGGERRRVSIGVEAVHDPRVLILDEPTSGLDSMSALQIVSMLRTMAEARGRTIILSIHQPGSRILKFIGSLLLLSDSAVVHHGTVDQLHSRLRGMGLQLPIHVNVLEFAMDSIDALRAELFESSHMQRDPQSKSVIQQLTRKLDRIEGVKRRDVDRSTLQQLFQQHMVVEGKSLFDLDLHYDYANSRLREVTILTHRYMKNVFRTKQLFACRTVQMLVSGLVLGSIFYDLGDDKIVERVGLFAFILTLLLSCSTESLPIFLQEREILMKETSSGSYRVSSYAIANGLAFLPFLLILAVLFSVPVYWLAGLNRSFPAFMYFVLLIWLILYTANSVVACISALAQNFIVGNSIIAGVMGAFFLFSGYFITKQAMPSYWVFMHYVSLFKYPFESLLLNEFSGSDRCLEGGAGACLLRAADLLEAQGLKEECRWKNVMTMVGFILAYRCCAYIILRCRCICVQKGGLKRALV